LVWKTILPIGSRSNKFGKWSPSWEGPYKVVKICSGNSYMVETLQGHRPPRALNGRYLKIFHPSVWQDAWKDMDQNRPETKKCPVRCHIDLRIIF
jgi:hypothetical protein